VAVIAIVCTVVWPCLGWCAFLETVVNEVPLIKVPGRMYPVQVHYCPLPDELPPIPRSATPIGHIQPVLAPVPPDVSSARIENKGDKEETSVPLPASTDSGFERIVAPVMPGRLPPKNKQRPLNAKPYVRILERIEQQVSLSTLDL
jgi:hypothetical protein